MSRIPLIYRIYFLLLDPIFALSGAYLILTQPASFLVATTPTSLTPLLAPTALTTLLLTNIASLYILFGFLALVLLQTRDLRIWRTILAGILVSDIGHAYALYAADPAAFVNAEKWRGEDWVNNGILVFGALMRVGFLMGVGGVRG